MTLHHYYDNIRAIAEQRSGESDTSRAAAELILRGVGFSNNYRRFNRASTLVLPTEIDVTSGMMPLVGFDLSRIVDLGEASKRDPEVAVCPAGWEEMPVEDWYVGDRYLMPSGPDVILLGGYSREMRRVIGETMLTTTPSNIFSSTETAVAVGIIPPQMLS